MILKENNLINLKLKAMQFTRINNDVNGNPRYVCHFSDIVNEQDREIAQSYGINYISELYRIAIKKANKIGGRKYHTKSFGGGIVFQSYCTQELEKNIKNL